MSTDWTSAVHAFARRQPLARADGPLNEKRLRARKLTGELPTIKHPSVGSIDMGSHATQRQTCQNSMSRTDAVRA